MNTTKKLEMNINRLDHILCELIDIQSKVRNVKYTLEKELKQKEKNEETTNN